MNRRMDKPEFFMHTSSRISGNKKFLGALPAACLSLLTLGSLSIYGIPQSYPVTLSILAMVITVVLIMVFRRATP